MLKKHKQFITGFILGAIIFSAIPVQAKVQEYLLQKSTAKVMVDGKEFANKELPVLNYKNYNYIPMATFREICNTIGVGFEWVGESSEVQISTENKLEKQETSPTLPIQEDTITRTDDENVIFINDVKYISIDGVGIHLENINRDKQYNDHYYISPFKDRTTKLYTLNQGEVNIIINNIIIKRVPGEEFYKNDNFIEYDFFQDKIVPSTK